MGLHTFSFQVFSCTYGNVFSRICSII